MAASGDFLGRGWVGHVALLSGWLLALVDNSIGACGWMGSPVGQGGIWGRERRWLRDARALKLYGTGNSDPHSPTILRVGRGAAFSDARGGYSFDWVAIGRIVNRQSLSVSMLPLMPPLHASVDGIEFGIGESVLRQQQGPITLLLGRIAARSFWL